MTQQVKRTSDSENPILTISAKNGWMDQKDRFNRVIAGKELKNYIELYKNELSYNHGNSKYAKFGIIYVQRKYEKALVPKVYHSFSMSYGDPRFIENLSLGHKLDKELSKFITSGARQDGLLNINKKSFYAIKLFIPSEQEQIKISNIMDVINHIITLYERKIKLFDDMIAYLKQQFFYKQSSLSFPQSYWKDIAFSKLYIKRKDKNIDVSYDQSKTISVANMKYSDRELNSSREYLKTYYITHFGDIIYEGNRSGNFKYGRFVQNNIGDGIVSHVFTVYKPINDLDMNFMNNFINYEPIMSKVLLYATTDTLMMHTLHDDELMKQKLSLPDKETQTKIGRILSLISTIKNKFSERKELLVKIKNTLLNTMFI